MFYKVLAFIRRTDLVILRSMHQVTLYVRILLRIPRRRISNPNRILFWANSVAVGRYNLLLYYLHIVIKYHCLSNNRHLPLSQVPDPDQAVVLPACRQMEYTCRCRLRNLLLSNPERPPLHSLYIGSIRLILYRIYWRRLLCSTRSIQRTALLRLHPHTRLATARPTGR